MDTKVKRLEQVKFSPVREILSKAQKMESEGKSVIHFEIGEPDFDTPEDIVEETIKALKNEKKTHYASNLGDKELRNAISEKFSKSNIEIDSDKEILITGGAAEAIFVSIMGLVNEGDEVIVVTPAFMFYENTINMAGGKMIEVMLKEEDNFRLPVNEIEKKINAKTKAIIINNPHNPSGTVFKKEDILSLWEIAVKNDIYIISDEIYDEIVYDDEQCYSVAAIDGFKSNAIIINGFSKAYAMTGWRLGYIISNAEMRQQMLKVHQYTLTCLPTFIQIGTARAMNKKSCLDAVEEMRGKFENRRNLLQQKLNEIKNLSYVSGKGAFYILINIGKTQISDREFAERLLAEKGVAVVPASSFTNNFKDHIRISYAVSEEDIEEGMNRIREFCDQFN